MTKVYFVIYKEVFKNISDINPYSICQDICIVEDEDVAKNYCNNRENVNYYKQEFEVEDNE